MNWLSSRDWVRRSCQINCTIRRRLLRGYRRGLIGTLTDRIEERVVHWARPGVVRGYNLGSRSSERIGYDRVGSRNGRLARRSTVGIDKGLDLWDMLNDEFYDWKRPL